jgi:hypothetical protein
MMFKMASLKGLKNEVKGACLGQYITRIWTTEGVMEKLIVREHAQYFFISHAAARAEEFLFFLNFFNVIEVGSPRFFVRLVVLMIEEVPLLTWLNYNRYKILTYNRYEADDWAASKHHLQIINPFIVRIFKCLYSNLKEKP